MIRSVSGIFVILSTKRFSYVRHSRLTKWSFSGVLMYFLKNFAYESKIL